MTGIPKYDSPPFADYETDPVRPSLIARTLPTLSFYSGVGAVVLAASREAKKGRFTDESWYNASLAVRKVFEESGATISVKGTEHVASLEQPCVFIGNHMSTAETFLLASIIIPFRKVTFVVKQSLVDYPVFKHIMRSRDPVVVGRVNPREDLKAVLEGGRALLESGTSLVIFPQRTRSETFDRESFNTIGIKLAKRTGVPVVPLALKTNAWSNGRFLKDFGPFHPQEKVMFEFGPALEVAKSDRETHEAVIGFIENRMQAWGVAMASNKPVES